jgi:hypothetical protein
MRTIFAVPIALALLTGEAWAAPLTVSATLTGVKKLCGGNDHCTDVQCGSTTCSGSCSTQGKACSITINRTGPTRPKPPTRVGSSAR